MKKNKERAFWLSNVLIPILIGAAIYYVMSPEVIFVKRIDAFWGWGFHMDGINFSNYILRFIRNYLSDMLWAYALVFALFFMCGNDTADLWRVFITAFAFSVVMEISQLTSFMKGTFDGFDIAAEFLAEIAAVFIIKNITLRGVQKNYEKKI